MPIVQIDFVDNRTVEQKRAMAQKITEAICETAKCPPEAVTIIIRDLPRHNFAKAGVLLSDK
jgi:4-oxalocrotonate tautomerase